MDFAAAYESAKGNSKITQAETRSTIQTAHMAFGGHISRGLLKRGRAANDKVAASSEKMFRAEVFLRISKLPNLWRTPSGTWDEVDSILDRCHLAADFSDKDETGCSPYYNANRGDMCYPKVQALRRFVTRYAGKRASAILLPKLNTSAPVSDPELFSL